MNLKKTISFFNRISLTDKELLALNEYILENSEHSFFDNAYMAQNEYGDPMNFIDDLRINDTYLNEVTSKDKNENHFIAYQTHFEDQPWSSLIDRI